MTPSPYEFVLLALAACYLWKVIRDGDILNRPRNALLDGLSDANAVSVVAFLWCPWCAGAWIVLALYSGWVALGPGVWDTSQLFMAAVSVLGLSAAVGVFGTVLARLYP